MLLRQEVIHRLAAVRADRWATRLMLAGLACLFAAFCASIAVVRTSMFEAQVGQTFEILSEARTLLSGLQDTETGQRGALLSQRADFLEPYNAAAGTVWPTYQKLRALAAEDPAQLARLDRMSALIAGKLKELAETLELDRTGRRNEALDRIRSGRGKVIMDQFRAEQAAFSQAELERLQRQKHALSRSRLIMLAAIFLSLLFALFLGYLALQSSLSARKHRIRAGKALRESEERFRALTNASSEVLYQMNPDWTEMVQLSGGGFLADTESPERDWLDRYIHWDDQPHVTAAIRKAIRTKSVFELEHRVRVAGGTIGWVLSRAVPMLNGRGEITSWFGAARNITARKRAEQHVQMLMREVNHRSKNMLALVQVIARQTVASNPKDFVTHFDERIQALAAAQDLLVKNEWKGVDVGELARSQLAHFKDLIGTRIELKGPLLFISASAAQTIGMALHELATNAGKYGALSNSKGRIAVEWSLDRAEKGAETFAIAWRESGGPAVTAPERQGFGSAIIGELAEMSLGAKADLSFASSGLSWRLKCEAGEIVDRSIPSMRDVNPVSGPQPAAQSCVLVVEDESLVAFEIAHVLRDAGFKVLGPAGSVIKGLELVSRKGCDAAVLDVNLGKETSEPIALELKKRGTPFVTLSAYSREQSPAIFGGAPALAKPLRPELLVAEIRSCLQRHAAA